MLGCVLPSFPILFDGKPKATVWDTRYRFDAVAFGLPLNERWAAFNQQTNWAARRFRRRPPRSHLFP